MESQNQKVIEQAYAAFNSRDIDGILKLMHPNVHWPKAFEGDFVSGHEDVRDYWTRQWNEINPHVEPTGFEERADGTFAVIVHQVVKDLQGNSIADGQVKHVYKFENGLIREMNIELN